MAVKPRVFIVHDTGAVNWFAAKRFGTPVVCVTGHVSNHDYDVAIDDLRTAMSDARSGDFLLPIGSPVLIAAAAVELAKRAGVLSVLTWDRKEERYNTCEVGSLWPR